MNKYLVAAHFEVVSGSFTDFVEEVKKVAQASVQFEPGCERYDAFVAANGEPRGMVYEVYSAKADHEAHQETDHFARFWQATADHKVKWVVDFGEISRQSEFIVPE